MREGQGTGNPVKEDIYLLMDQDQANKDQILKPNPKPMDYLDHLNGPKLSVKKLFAESPLIVAKTFEPIMQFKMVGLVIVCSEKLAI